MAHAHRVLLRLPGLLLVPIAALSAQLSAVGPVTADNGFPFWYRDASPLQLDQVTMRVSISNNLVGRTFFVQAVDLGNCLLGNINSHVY